MPRCCLANSWQPGYRSPLRPPGRACLSGRVVGQVREPAPVYVHHENSGFDSPEGLAVKAILVHRCARPGRVHGSWSAGLRRSPPRSPGRCFVGHFARLRKRASSRRETRRIVDFVASGRDEPGLGASVCVHHVDPQAPGAGPLLRRAGRRGAALPLRLEAARGRAHPRVLPPATRLPLRLRLPPPYPQCTIILMNWYVIPTSCYRWDRGCSPVEPFTPSSHTGRIRHS